MQSSNSCANDQLRHPAWVCDRFFSSLGHRREIAIPNAVEEPVLFELGAWQKETRLTLKAAGPPSPPSAQRYQAEAEKHQGARLGNTPPLGVMREGGELDDVNV